jgi:hypothetical protein
MAPGACLPVRGKRLLFSDFELLKETSWYIRTTKFLIHDSSEK